MLLTTSAWATSPTACQAVTHSLPTGSLCPPSLGVCVVVSCTLGLSVILGNTVLACVRLVTSLLPIRDLCYLKFSHEKMRKCASHAKHRFGL